ncbi:ABC transporter substrate-binding protein [Kushneria aurantia]|uniref:ABC transporter substrate-binding protein n=1 Tax=Kushneria aurantia TaxID=504092 RepID=A0ABV6G664_9GAMM|nr:ABC transporter substrate-binding protein [Kushneria aurantia]
MLKKAANAVLCCLLIAGSGTAGAEAPHTGYPVTLDNCGDPQTFEQAPQRVVTLGQHETELLLSLGLAERMVGSAIWFGPVAPQLRQDNARVPRLNDNAPSFEAVLATRPDFVAAQYSYHLGPNGEVAGRDQFEALGINTWVSPSDCVGKSVTASSNSDGARSEPFSMALIEREIRQMARIFDVQVRGEALMASLEERIAKARTLADSVRDGDEPLTVVYWFSSATLDGDPWVAGNVGAPAVVSKALGLDNVIDSDQEWPAVSWERIAAANPDVLVITEMARRLYPADDVQAKRDFLRSDPLTRQLDAVQNERIIVVPAQTLNPSLRVVEAIETVAGALAQYTEE